jgi:multidrug efflux pump subunit AcrB
MANSKVPSLVLLWALVGVTGWMLLPGCQEDSSVDDGLAGGRDAPTWWVRVKMPGASADEVEQQVVVPLEGEVSMLPEVSRIITNYAGGVAEMTITARAGTPAGIFQQKLKMTLAEAAQLLPAEASEPELLDHDPLGTLMKDPEQADMQVAHLEVFLDRQVLSRHGLSVEEVLKKVREAGLDAAAPDQGEEGQDLAEALSQVELTDQEQPVLLADVARIVDRGESQPEAKVRVWPGTR